MGRTKPCQHEPFSSISFPILSNPRSGEAIDFTHGRAGKDNIQVRFFEGSIGLGSGQGKIGLKTSLGWVFGLVSDFRKCSPDRVLAG